MHQKLIENSAFLRYYEKWQENPASVVFVPIAEMLRLHGLLDDAIKVAVAGLKYHPELISGRIALARCYLAKGAPNLAKEQAEKVLMLMPENEEAQAILGRRGTRDEGRGMKDEGRGTRDEGRENREGNAWNTLTMARILASQGHLQEAKDIYNVILKNEPNNEEARKELGNLLTW